MILPSIKRILIVPDFGNAEAAERLLPLKEAIQEHSSFDAKIIDLRQMIFNENPDKKLKEAQILDLAARRLETLVADKTIVWKKSNLSIPYPDIELSSYDMDDELDRKSLEEPFNPEHPDDPDSDNGLQPGENLSVDSAAERIIRRGRLTIRVSRTPKEHFTQHAPHAIVVFGKSVMLAGGVKDIPVLFVDPEYDKEWPWRKRYYVDRKEADSFYHSFTEKFRAPFIPEVLSNGYEAEYRRKQPQRFCLLTVGNDEDEFSERYPRLAMSDPEFQDPRQLAKAIREFTGEKLEMPMLDIYELLKVPARGNTLYPLMFNFPHPVDVDGQKAVAIELQGLSPYRMPGEEVIFEGCAYKRSLEDVHDRQSLLSLREAMTEAVKTMPQRKRILIVPDCLTPKDSPIAPMLRDYLQKEDDYHVAVFENNSSLKDSRRGLERCCRKRPFDLIVTLETGCLLAARVINTPRIFVNPDWTVWKDMKKCGYEREEWETARIMGMKAHIRHDGPHWAMGWFSLDQIDSEAPREHMDRFISATYPPHIGLTNQDGIRRLAWEIHKMLL
ncbi:MAG: hypothetical protein K2H38_02880 [Muribaculaceae bacterium]|nr:hypothetical protein [Muribaculaceae bacterium]